MSNFWQIMTALGAGSASVDAGKAANETKRLNELKAKEIEENHRHNQEMLELQKEQTRLAAMTDKQKLEYQKEKAKEEELDASYSKTFGNFNPNDPIVLKAVKAILSARKFSRGYLQGYLGVNKDFATVLAIWFEEMGIIGPIDGDKAREVLISTMEDYDKAVRKYAKEHMND